MKKSTVLILNYNGKNLLAKNLPAVIGAAKFAKSKVVVVDNGSDDGSIDFVVNRFPQVKTIVFGSNLGFGEGNNQAVRTLKTDIVILLNNDVSPRRAAFRYLLKHFHKNDVFAAAARQIVQRASGTTQGGSAIPEFSRGLLRHKPAVLPQNHWFPILYASGGAAAFDRKKFIALGGFDRLYAPFYWEDADLGAMAWARGWQVLFEPKSVVGHRHETTIKKIYPAWYVNAVGYSNMLIFNWRHLNGLSYWLKHFAWLPFHLIRRPFGGLLAIVKIPHIIQRRFRDKHRLDIAALSRACKAD